MTVRVKIDKLPYFRALFRSLEKFGADPQGLLMIWGARLERSTRARFDTGRGPGGIPWPLSKRVQKFGGKTLVDKGVLEGGIVFRVSPRTLEVGVDSLGRSTKYSYVHQFGFEGPVQVQAHTRFISQAFGIPLPERKETKVKAHERKMKIPRRPFLGIDDEDKRDMREDAREHVRGILGNG